MLSSLALEASLITPLLRLHPGACAQVNFSEFMRRVRRNEVAAVVVDDRRLTFAARPGSSLLPCATLQGARYQAGFPVNPSPCSCWAVASGQALLTCPIVCMQ